MSTPGPFDDLTDDFTGSVENYLPFRACTRPETATAAERISLGAGRNSAVIARFPCSKCGGSGRFVSWAGRDCGPCNRCHGAGKQKTDPNAARLRREKAEATRAENAARLVEAWNAANPTEAAWILANLKFDFAASLAQSLVRFGSLTENQLAAVRRCIEREATRATERAERKADANVAGEGFARMVAAFAAASASGLRRPKFRVGELEFSPAKATSKNPGCLYVVRTGTYIGKITATGEFFAAREATDTDKAEVARIGADPLAAAVMHGKQTGACSCCGRTLENEESVALGIGPICRAKWGLK